jgi:hypothetical protein
LVKALVAAAAAVRLRQNSQPHLTNLQLVAAVAALGRSQCCEMSISAQQALTQ